MTWLSRPRAFGEIDVELLASTSRYDAEVEIVAARADLLGERVGIVGAGLSAGEQVAVAGEAELTVIAELIEVLR